MLQRWYGETPTATDLEEPTYRALEALGGRAFHKDISTAVIDMYDLYDVYDWDKLLKNLAFARSRLKAKGWIDNPHQGMWEIIA